MRKLEFLLHMYALCSIQHNKEVMILTLYWLLESFPESGRHSLHITASVYYFRTDIKKWKIIIRNETIFIIGEILLLHTPENGVGSRGAVDV